MNTRLSNRTIGLQGFPGGSALKQGANYWRMEYAGRVSVIVDAADYIATF